MLATFGDKKQQTLNNYKKGPFILRCSIFLLFVSCVLLPVEQNPAALSLLPNIIPITPIIYSCPIGLLS